MRRPSGISNTGTGAASDEKLSPRARVVESVAALRAELAPARRAGASVGLVPTMGAFHEGHLSLMRRARAECDVVVVSLFVNPGQFGPGEDLRSYPRDHDRDVRLANAERVDVLFMPSFEEVYPTGFATAVEVAGLSETLCGALGSRGAGHFRSVATVVTKLLNMCGPDVAYFGAKDYQQALIVKRLVEDLDMPVHIEVCPIVRDADGLALSSRNAYLTPDERLRALSLSRALEAAREEILRGAVQAADVAEAARGELQLAGVDPEYVEVRSAADLSPLQRLGSEDVLVAIAARIGRARLIDNVVVQPTSAAADSSVKPRRLDREAGSVQC
jgi:pantoate--beta-alanine ligase